MSSLVERRRLQEINTVASERAEAKFYSINHESKSGINTRIGYDG
jgi:hypothetical protein